MKSMFNRMSILVLLLLALAIPALADPSVMVGATASGSTAAVQVTTVAGGTKVTSATGSRKGVEIQNLGPNPIYCRPELNTATSSAIATTNGRQIAANGGVWSIDLGVNVAVWCIAATAVQVSPNDTRVTEVK